LVSLWMLRVVTVSC